MVNPCCLGGFWHVQATKCWPFGWIGHIPVSSLLNTCWPFRWYRHRFLGILAGYWPFGRWTTSLLQPFWICWPFGWMEKELSDCFCGCWPFGWNEISGFQVVFPVVDLLGGSSICPVRTDFSSEKLGILAGFHPKNQDSRLDFQSKCWPFRWEVLTF